MKNCEAVSGVTTKILKFHSSDENIQGYLRKISKIPILSYEEEKELAKKMKEGDLNAKRKLVRANLRLAANIAAKIKNPNMTLSDLIQEANIGLIVAVEKYNYKLGYKFSTYASWWIKQAVLKSISEQSGCMKVPVYVQEIVGKYSKMKSKLENELKISLSIGDMAKRMNINSKKLEEYVSAFQSNMSLDETITNDSAKEISLMDIIADQNANATAQAEYESLKKAISEAMSVLKEREQKVVILRFGLDNNSQKTLDEIGKMFGVTKECIRQTELRAIKRLKNFCKSNDIDLYCCQ